MPKNSSNHLDAIGRIDYHEGRDSVLLNIGAATTIFTVLMVGLHRLCGSWQKAALLLLALIIAIGMGAAFAYSRKNRTHATVSFICVLAAMVIFGYCSANI